MDALVKAALDRVNETVNSAADYAHGPLTMKEQLIAKAINAVDALKSALKTL